MLLEQLPLEVVEDILFPLKFGVLCSFMRHYKSPLAKRFWEQYYWKHIITIRCDYSTVSKKIPYVWLVKFLDISSAFVRDSSAILPSSLAELQVRNNFIGRRKIEFPVTLSKLDGSFNGLLDGSLCMSAIATCSNLTHVNLSNNKLATFPPFSLVIQHINLSHNQILDLPPGCSLLHYPQLHYLNMYDNWWTRIPKLSGNIVHLNVGKNSFSNHLNLDVSPYSRLEYLNLGENLLKVIPPLSKSIVTIDLSDNKFQSTDPGLLICTKLKRVVQSRSQKMLFAASVTDQIVCCFPPYKFDPPYLYWELLSE